MSWIRFITELSIPVNYSGIFAPDYVNPEQDLLHGYNSKIQMYVITHRDYPYSGLLEGNRYYRRAMENVFIRQELPNSSDSTFLYQGSLGSWYLCESYGILPEDGSGTEIWEGTLPDENSGTATFTSTRTSNASAPRTLTYCYPRYESDEAFGVYTAVGMCSNAPWTPSGTKTFGNPRWSSGSIIYFIRTSEKINGKYIYRSKTGVPDLIYDSNSEKWVCGEIPNGEGSWLESDTEPEVDTSFALVEKRKTSDGNGGYTTTQTLYAECAFNDYGYNTDETAKILVFYPEILT